MIREIRKLPPAGVTDAGVSLTDREKPGIHGAIGTITYMTGQLPWVPDSSNERIVGVIQQIGQKRPIRTLAIWGWVPGVYVLTGIPPSTRYAVSGPMIGNPGSSYSPGKSRFLADLEASPPDLFIDAIVPGTNMWRDWGENSGYESDGALRNFVDSNYQLVAKLALKKGAKPVRFFVRRTAS